MITTKKRKGAAYISQLAKSDGIEAVKDIDDKFLLTWQCFVNQFRVDIKACDLWKLTSVCDLDTYVLFTGFYRLKVTQVEKAMVVYYFRDSNTFQLFEASNKIFDSPSWKC